MKTTTIAFAALIMGGLTATRGGAQVPIGARVRVTTVLGFHYQGRLTALDSSAVTVQPEDSTPEAHILRSDVQKFERSLGIEMVTTHEGWAEAATLVGAAGGAVYGATGWGANARPKGVLGGLLGGLAGGSLVAWLVGDISQVTQPEERWKKVDLNAAFQPVITSGAGGRLLLGVSFSLR